MVTTDIRRQTFNCDGVAQDFTITFPFIETANIKVYRIDDLGAITLLTEGSAPGQYSISSPTFEYNLGGTIHTVTLYAAGNQIVAIRDVDLLQELNLIEGDLFPADTVEEALDKLTMVAQQINEESVNGPDVSTDEHISLFDGTTGGTLKESAHDEDDLDDFRTHVDGDGSDHADVALGNAHRLGNGADHANVALADAHRIGDGSDHADVATNTADMIAHRAADPLDHPDSSVTFGKMQDISASTFMGRPAIGTGAPEELDKTAALTILNVEDGADVTDAVNVAAAINSVAAKATPINADIVPLIDTEDSNKLKKVTFSTAIALVKTYFDTLYATLVHTHAATDITSANLNVARMPTGGNWTLTSILSILGKFVEVVQGIYTNMITSLDRDAYYIYYNGGITIMEVFERVGAGELSTDGGGNWIIVPGGSRSYYVGTGDPDIVFAWQTGSPGKWTLAKLGTLDPAIDWADSNGLTPPVWSTPSIPSVPAYGAGTYVKKHNYLHINPGYSYTILQQVDALNPDEYIFIGGVAIGPAAYDSAQIQGNLYGRHAQFINKVNIDSYTLADEDAGKYQRQTKATVNTVTVPLNSSIPIAAGKVYHFCQSGAGAVTIAAATGVTINGVLNGSALIWAQYGVVTLVKVNTNEWECFGAVGVFA